MKEICTALEFTVIHTSSYVSFTTMKEEPILLALLENYFLVDSCSSLFHLLFNCPDMTTRQYIAKFTATVINRAFSIIGVCTSIPKDKEHARVLKLQLIVKDIMNMILLQLTEREVQKSWSKLTNYFTMMLDIAKGG